MKSKILVLNKYYVPIAVSDHRDVFGNIFSESMYPLDITYEEDENGEINLESMSYCNVVKGPNAWCSLPVRRYDEYLNTTKGSVRIPPVVICSEYAGIPHKRVEFPTKYNIIKRDNGTCGYTGKKLSKDELSIDHIFPKSRCAYNPNTWENQVCCHKELNIWKADNLPEECDLTKAVFKDPWLNEWKNRQSGRQLKLIRYPKKPTNGFTFGENMDAWTAFLKNA